MTARPDGRANDEGDGPANGLQVFAQEMRAQREVAGLTQEQLAKLMGYSPSVIAKLETCRTIPSPQHAGQADEASRTPGTFRRLRQAMINGAHEPWVRALLDMEERATVLRNWESLVVPGLLQAEAYNALDGQVTERRKQVSRVALLYEKLRTEALSPGASREMIMKVADETWRT